MHVCACVFKCMCVHVRSTLDVLPLLSALPFEAGSYTEPGACPFG